MNNPKAKTMTKVMTLYEMVVDTGEVRRVFMNPQEFAGYKKSKLKKSVVSCKKISSTTIIFKTY